MAVVRASAFRSSNSVRHPPDGPEINPVSVCPCFEMSGVIFLAPSFSPPSQHRPFLLAFFFGSISN
jgi:hypothetical protein